MEKLFIDSNILVHTANPQSPVYEAAMTELQKHLQGGSELFISSQILREYASVMTGKVGMNVTDTQGNIERFMKEMTVLYDTPESSTLWRELVTRYDVKGRNIHDCNIAATMIANGVKAILTHNGKDFMRYKEITVIPLG